MTNKLTSPFTGISNDFITYISHLQQDITQTIESYETDTRFLIDNWDRSGGGGGITMVLENGSVFEKAGVNISAIEGQLNKDSEITMFSSLLKQQNKEFNVKHATFFATGISLVIHPVNPFCPTVHMNYRYFEMKQEDKSLWWFGGGSDLTPAIEFEEDNQHFHNTLKSACDPFDQAYYPTFKEKCDNYFYLPHRNEARGIGGIFFDYLNKKDQQHYFELCKACGSAFNNSYFPIIDRRHKTIFTENDQIIQHKKRGRYVEFNLLYDRGTLFGLKTGGRIESILMSLPPQARWTYK